MSSVSFDINRPMVFSSHNHLDQIVTYKFVSYTDPNLNTLTANYRKKKSKCNVADIDKSLWTSPRRTPIG